MNLNDYRAAIDSMIPDEEIDRRLREKILFSAKHRARTVRPILVIAIILFVLFITTTGLALFTDLDFLRLGYVQDIGFVYPNHQWGMTPEQVMDETGYTLINDTNSQTVSFEQIKTLESVSYMALKENKPFELFENKCETYYQFSYGKLICVDMTFANSRIQPGNDLEKLSAELINTLKELYSTPNIETIGSIKQDNTDASKLSEAKKMQNALREYLGLDALSDDSDDVNEVEIFSSSGKEAEKEPQNAMIRYSWTDETTKTAISLSVSYMDSTTDSMIRTLRISFASYAK